MKTKDMISLAVDALRYAFVVVKAVKPELAIQIQAVLDEIETSIDRIEGEK